MSVRSIQTKGVLEEVQEERQRQDEIWGLQNHGVCGWMLILSEEFGEAAKDANQIHFEKRKDRVSNYRSELVQVAAVAVAAIESLDRGYK